MRAMSNVTDFQHVALNLDCVGANIHNPAACFFAPVAAAFVQTPLFVFNAEYDWYVLGWLGVQGLERCTKV